MKQTKNTLSCHCEERSNPETSVSHYKIHPSGLPHSAPLRSQWQIYQKPHKPASVLGFTLIELIVVITILAILGTIGFIQLWSFAGSARDSARISNLTNLKKGLDLFQIKSGIYPMPESSVAITASGVTIGYQGFAKDVIAWLAKLSPGGTIDPSDATIFTTYTVNQNQSKMQAMVFLEDSSTLTAFLPPLERGVGGIFPTANASSTSDYSTRYPTTIGDGLGILLSNTGTNIGKPAQEIASIIASGSVDIQRTTDEYKAYFSKSDTISGTGTQLQSLQISYNYGAGYNAPSSCPTGFIPVPWNKDDFKQPGFCVAKYEMKYASSAGHIGCGGLNGTDICDTETGTEGWYSWQGDDTVGDTWTKGTIVSKAEDYPIADITQSRAIAACKSMGVGYHLITNNEWMTIARNIEQQSTNWNTGIVGSGGIFRGNVNLEDTLGCVGDTVVYTENGSSSDNQNLSSVRTTCTDKRQMKLSNNQTIWDISGNVWEHVNKANTLDGSDHATGENKTFVGKLTTDVDAAWVELNTVTTPYFTNNILPKNTALLKANGIGGLWFYNGTIFLRGGSGGNGADSGVFTLNLNWSPADANRNVGFRCAR